MQPVLWRGSRNICPSRRPNKMHPSIRPSANIGDFEQPVRSEETEHLTARGAADELAVVTKVVDLRPDQFRRGSG
jgi:hypothetical protein